MELEFEAVTIEWRGPAPFVFAPVPIELSAEIKAISNLVTYGWGVIPATVRLGNTEYSTSLFPKGLVYLVPIKVAVQRAEGVKIGDSVNLFVSIAPTFDSR